MKVALFRDLPTERWWSMERYADELTTALRQIGCDVHPFAAARPLPQLRGTANALANYVWRSVVYPLAACSQQCEVNHIVDHSYAHLIHALDARRTVVTCHDIAPLALDERGRGISRYLWDRSFRAMLRAECIVADSAHTRAEILQHSDYPAERIHVAPLGVSPEFFEPLDVSDLRAQHHLASQYVVLHVGSCAPRKNVALILRALAELRELPIRFVQIGGRFGSDDATLIESLGLSDLITQITSVSETDLGRWYRAADVFVLPSLYEGFGLPVLEAMASGTPVICANATSLPEVAGDAALLIDPHDSHALSSALRLVLTDPARAADLRQRGFERARMFTWERTARETLAVYERVESEC